MPKIKAITIRAVRGIRDEIRLEPRGKSLLIQGDNGTGKSSVVQALEWALRGKKAPTDGTAYRGEEGFRVHVLERAASAKVELELTGDSRIVATLAGTSVDACAADYQGSCTKADPFLRRSQLLQFLGQKPIERFRYLESFLDLNEADRIREQLAERATALKGRAEALKQDRQNALNAISLAMPSNRRPLAVTWVALERSFFAWARELSLIEHEEHQWSAVELAAKKAHDTAADDSSATKRVRLESAITTLGALHGEVTALPDLLRSSQRLTQEVERTTDAGLVALLEHARAHFERAPDEHCPVCEQEIDPASVAESIRNRLASLTTVKSLMTERDTSSDVWRRCFHRVAEALARTKEDFQVSPQDSAPPTVALLAEAADVVDFAAKVVAVGCEPVRQWMLSAVQSLMDQLAASASEIPREDKTDLILFSKAVDEAVKRRVSTDLVSFLEADVEEQARQLGAIAEAIRLARQDVAQKLLDEIAATVAEYYRLIHPEDHAAEVTGAPKIDVQRNRGGIAFLRGSFNDRAVEDPRWVYSDGHLDTVGICVFLALRRFRADQTGDAKLMVLDDVVLSIDLSHARRLLEVLRDHFSDHQVLLFTHNGLFASWVQSLLPSFERKTITGWTLEGGVKLGDLKSASQRLSKSIEESASPKEIAQAMMTLMDEALLEARFAYQLSVPARRGEQYTLAELWDPLCKRLKEIEKALKAPLGNTRELLEQLTDLPRVRNMLAAHENEFAREFPLTAIRDLAILCRELMSRLHCAECASFVEPVPTRSKPDLVSCRCKKITYVHPNIASAVLAGTDAATGGD